MAATLTRSPRGICIRPANPVEINPSPDPAAAAASGRKSLLSVYKGAQQPSASTQSAGSAPSEPARTAP